MSGRLFSWPVIGDTLPSLMSFRTGIICSLWDLVDEGIDAVLDCVHGELGAGRVVLPLATGPVAQLRPRVSTGQRIFRTAGGIHFTAEPDRYEATRCKPLVADWLHGRHPADTVVGGCRDRGLELWVSLATSELGRMVAKHPEAAVKNVFGDCSQHRLCLLNGDVAELLRVLTLEVAERFEPDAIVLTGLMSTGLDWQAERLDGSPRFDVVGRLLAGLCFCESCRQQGATADVDMESAAHVTAHDLSSVLEGGPATEASIGAWLCSNPPAADWLAFRVTAILSWLTAVRAATRCPVYLQMELDDAATVAGLANRVELPTVQPRLLNLSDSIDPSKAKEQLAERLTGCDVESTGFVLPAFDPTAVDGRGLVQSLTAAAELGVPSVNLFQYGLLPRGRMQEVRQAIRFAGRSGN